MMFRPRSSTHQIHGHLFGWKDFNAVFVQSFRLFPITEVIGSFITACHHQRMVLLKLESASLKKSERNFRDRENMVQYYE